MDDILIHRVRKLRIVTQEVLKKYSRKSTPTCQVVLARDSMLEKEACAIVAVEDVLTSEDNPHMSQRILTGPLMSP